MRRWTEVIVGIGVAVTALGCIGREVAKVVPDTSKEQYKDIPVVVNRDVDILFVIDNSGSMAEEQSSLLNNFNRFTNVLTTIQGGLPNVHIGVVSTDVGAGPYSIQGCTGNGDNGILQNTPRVAGCSTPAGKFISNTLNEDGTRDVNYSGTLDDTFTCIAALGTGGCGFEQPFEAMRRALNNANVENAGFLREKAYLAVIFITDEDDCSVEKTEMFNTSDDPAVTTTLGPLGSFRCFEFGVKCDPDSPRNVGDKANCVPRDDSQYMYGVDQYIQNLRDLKASDDQIIVAGIIGNSSPVVVGANSDGEPTLQPSCVSNSGEAAPAVRVATFLDAFRYTTTTTICNEDLSDALINIATLLAQVVGNPCLSGNLTDTDPDAAGVQPNCVVYDEVGDRQTLIAQCVGNDPAGGPSPCWTTTPDAVACTSDLSPTNLVFQVHPTSRAVDVGTHTVVRCEAD